MSDLPQKRHVVIGGNDVYTFRTQRAAEKYINDHAHMDLRVEIFAHDANTNLLTHFLSNPGDYSHPGASISYVQDEMHRFRSLSDFLKDNAPVSGLEDASFQYYQIHVHLVSRSGNVWGRNVRR